MFKKSLIAIVAALVAFTIGGVAKQFLIYKTEA